MSSFNYLPDPAKEPMIHDLVRTDQNDRVEIFSARHSHDVFLFMVRVTEANVEFWRSFALMQSRLGTEYSGDDLKIKYVDKGVKGFLPSLDYFDKPDNDIWVAFASSHDDEAFHGNAGAIEMFMSVLTTRNARFTSHMGVTRSVSYKGPPHPNLAGTLHCFAATVALRRYQNKVYMINVPAARMREILHQRLCDIGRIGDVYIGDGTGVVYVKGKLIDYQSKSIETCTELQRSIIRQDFGKCGSALAEYEENELTLALLKQSRYFGDWGGMPPIRVHRAPGTDQCVQFTIYSKDGQVLDNMTAADMTGEYSWFFESPWLIKNVGQPALSVNLAALAELERFEHISYSGSDYSEQDDLMRSG